MQGQIERFSRVAAVQVLPDRRSWRVCGGPFSATTLRTGLSARSPRAVQYRRVTTDTGELDGAKGTDGG
jgi:hypothetical protein